MMIMRVKGHGLSLTFKLNGCLWRRRVCAVAKVRETDDEWRTAKSLKELPGPKEYPFIKGLLWFYNFGGFGRDQLTKMHRHHYKTFGQIWKLPKVPFLDDNIIVLHNPDAHALVYQNEGKYPNRNFFKSIKEYRNRNLSIYKNAGVVAENGESWYNIRSKVQPFLLKKSLLSHHIPGLDQVSIDFVNSLSSLLNSHDETVDFTKDLYRWALESIATVALDTRLGCLDADLKNDSESFLMITSVNQLFKYMSQVEIGVPLYKLYDTQAWKNMCNAIQTLERVGMKYINKKLEALDLSNPDGYSTVLEGLLSVKALDRNDALMTMLDMLTAGIDTTSHAMAFLLYHLAINPDVQNKLFEEIRNEIPDQDLPITKNNLEKLRYMKATIKESMRISPVVDTGARIIVNDLIIHGYRIPKGTVCLLQQSVSSMSEEYFDNPEEFIPERWLKMPEGKSKVNPYATLPFGHGPRMCIGRRIADMEMWILTSRLLQKYIIEYHHQPVEKTQRIVGLPDRPLKLRFLSRR